jgi:hypothetical protein
MSRSNVISLVFLVVLVGTLVAQFLWRESREREFDKQMLAIATPALEEVAEAYHRYIDQHQKPPANLEELKPFIGIKTLLSGLRAGNLVVRYGMVRSPEADTNKRTLVAYWKTYGDSPVPVVMMDKQVKTLTPDELQGFGCSLALGKFARRNGDEGGRVFSGKQGKAIPFVLASGEKRRVSSLLWRKRITGSGATQGCRWSCTARPTEWLPLGRGARSQMHPSTIRWTQRLIFWGGLAYIAYATSQWWEPLPTITMMVVHLRLGEVGTRVAVVLAGFLVIALVALIPCYLLAALVPVRCPKCQGRMSSVRWGGMGPATYKCQSCLHVEG